MRRGFIKALAASAAGLVLGHPARAADDRSQGEATSTMKPTDVQAFDGKALSDRLADQDDPYLEFLRVPSLTSGIYRLPAGGVDRQSPHKLDEVYYVIRGKAVLFAGGEEHPAGPGSIFYVKAGVEHRFHGIEEDLEVLVFFSRQGE